MSIRRFAGEGRSCAQPPRRHSRHHGIIAYKSIWNSLNVIFLTYIAFQVVSLAKQGRLNAGATGKAKP